MFINPLIFIFAAITAFYLPGDTFISRLKLHPLERIVSALALGISLWAMQGFIFGFLNLRFLTYIYLFGFSIIWIFFNKNKSINFKSLKIDKLFLFLIILGSISQLSAVWFMGHQTDRGIQFCCRGVPDAIYHLALTNSLVESVPPQEPGMAGVIVHDYHYLSNLVVADLVRVYHLPLLPTQFQYMNLLLVTIIGFSILTITQMLNLKIIYARFLALFIYFSGSILFLLTLFRGRGLNFNIEILDDASKMLAGPPRAFSITLLIAALPLFLIWIKTKKIYPGVLLSLILGSLIGFKVYSGLFAAFGMIFLSIYFIYKKRFSKLIPILFTFLIMAVLYLSVNKLAGGLELSGFWRLENFMLTKDLGISKLEFIRLSFLNQNNFIMVWLFEILFLLIYLVFQFGTISIGFIQSKKSLSFFPPELNIFLISGLIASLSIGLFSTQNPGGANSVQFIISFFIIASIYAALACYYWITKIPRQFVSVVICSIIILTGAFSLHEVFFNYLYMKNYSGYMVNNSELTALQKIRAINSKGLILLDYSKLEDEKLLYLTFLSKERLYLAGTGLLKDHGVAIQYRETTVNNIFSSKDQIFVQNALIQNNIKYIFLSGSNEKFIGNYKIIYASGDTKILQVN